MCADTLVAAVMEDDAKKEQMRNGASIMIPTPKLGARTATSFCKEVKKILAFNWGGNYCARLYHNRHGYQVLLREERIIEAELDEEPSEAAQVWMTSAKRTAQDEGICIQMHLGLSCDCKK